MTKIETRSEAIPNLSGKYLTFNLSDESYGINVRDVREIIRQPSITRLPQMPKHIRGVINLRGHIVPVVDLRLRLGMTAAAKDESTCVIVVEVKVPSHARIQIGLVVGNVEEVVNVGSDEIEPTPHFGAQLDTRHIVGMAKVRGSVKTLLDIAQVVFVQPGDADRLAAIR